ncbi:MAG: hypothetical protein ACI4LY_05065 [Candidatus Fimisoma sp.]
MESKIIFSNETTYTQDIGMEAGEAFWKVQPAYRKKAKKFKIMAAVLAVTFVIFGILLTSKSGIGVMAIASFVMAAMGVFAFFRGEKMIKDSAKRLSGIGTRVKYGISENYFFVLNREYVGTEKAAEDNEEAAEAEAEAAELEEDGDSQTQEADSDDAQEESVLEDVEEDHEDDEEDDDEFLSLEDLLACIVTENLYILIWAEPYYIMERKGFDVGTDEEFRKFIGEKARVIEA